MTPQNITYLILIICAVGACGIIVGLWVIIAAFRVLQDLRGKAPHPPNEQIQLSHEQLVRDHKETRARLIALENWRGGLSDQLSESNTSILNAGEQRELRLEESMQGVRKELDSKIDTKFDGLDKKMDRKIDGLEGKIEAMPERILNMLKNIKGLS